MPATNRILDANANRAREAMRVMEESARFLLDDANLTQQLKQLRHDFSHAMTKVPALDTNRNTPGDVGTRWTAPGELARESVVDTVIAAGMRLSEALRTIEEFLKATPNIGLASDIEQFRYRAYDLEQRLNLAHATGRAQQWRLCLILSQRLCRIDWTDVLDIALAAGVDCVQLREKGIEDGELLERARQVARQCRGRATFIVNDRPDIALLAGADGVHVGQLDLPLKQVRKLVGRQLLVGMSTTDLGQAVTALQQGADYCGVGPIFSSTTKVKERISGLPYLRQYLSWGKLPHLAISGIDANNINPLVDAGAKGVAVSSAICSADNPSEVCHNLLAALEPSRGANVDITGSGDSH